MKTTKLLAVIFSSVFLSVASFLPASATDPTISWDENGGSTIPDSQFSGGTVVEPSEPSLFGKYFGGWSTSETSDQGDASNRITSWPYTPGGVTDTTLHAIWLDPCAFIKTSYVATGTGSIDSATYGPSGEKMNEIKITSTGECAWIVPQGITVADVALVAGGGSGGWGSRGGGGGAGELLYSPSSVGVTAGNALLVRVGSGGSAQAGQKGGDTIFASFTALGGGAGYGDSYANVDGGSGGGSRKCAISPATTPPAPGSSTSTARYSEFTELGNDGGVADVTIAQPCTSGGFGGGGGGAGSAGYQGLTTRGGNGGDAFTVFGATLAGGGGGYDNGTAVHSSGGADNGVTVGGSYVGGLLSGVVNTGSGGASGGAGADGVVLIRHLAVYDLNFQLGTGGSGTSHTLTKVTNVSATLPDSTTANSWFTQNGFEVAGWSLTDGGNLDFAFSEAYATDADLSLYPVWTVGSAAPYTGPLLQEFSSRTLDVCTPKSITITGVRLSGVTASVQGKSVTVLENTATKLVLAFPAGLTPGQDVDLVINSSSGTLTHQDAFDIPADTCETELSKGRWTQLQSDGTTVKMYAKDPIGDGKIQFFVDGEEIAWVNAADEADPKLSFASSNPYLVRSVELKPGKNRFEIKLDGVRVWRATYVPNG